MTTPNSPAALRDELNALEAQIAELQRTADDLRSQLAETSDKTSTIEAAERQEALISQLDCLKHLMGRSSRGRLTRLGDGHQTCSNCWFSSTRERQFETVWRF